LVCMVRSQNKGGPHEAARVNGAAYDGAARKRQAK
jgi:hypothetical protein